MPFDVLPHHDIKYPQPQLYFPPWQLAASALQARQNMYNMMLKGLDSVLSAADPVNIANRRLAIASVPYKLQELQYQTEMLKARADWMRDNPGKPFPGTWGEIMSMMKANNMAADIGRVKGYTTDPGAGGTVPAERQVPSYYPTFVPKAYTNPFETPSTTGPSEENVEKYGPLPGAFKPEDLTGQPPETGTPPAASADTGEEITGDVTNI